jgi:hypothetical protein
VFLLSLDVTKNTPILEGSEKIQSMQCEQFGLVQPLKPCMKSSRQADYHQWSQLEQKVQLFELDNL